MAVTELARLHLTNNKSLDSPGNETVQAQLLSAIKSQAQYAGYPVYLFTEVEDPSYVYLLGGWNSMVEHMEKWIPSEENQKILLSIKDSVEVAWLQHIDIDPGLQHLSTANDDETGGNTIPLTAPVIAVGRYFVQDSKRGDFQEAFYAYRHHLEALTAPRSLSSGWRLDPERRKDSEGSGKDEFVLFSGWDAVEDHLKFADSKGFRDFAKIKESLEGAGIKHAVRWTTS